MQSPESVQARRRANAGAPKADPAFNLSKLLQALQRAKGRAGEKGISANFVSRGSATDHAITVG
jgi:hypothetical protein